MAFRDHRIRPGHFWRSIRSRNRTEVATFTPDSKQEVAMADNKTKSEDVVPQADKQAHTDIAERQGKEGDQARTINKEEAEKRKGS